MQNFYSYRNGSPIFIQVLLSSTPCFIGSFVKEELKGLTEISFKCSVKVHEQT